jgi:hypothetical protein
MEEAMSRIVRPGIFTVALTLALLSGSSVQAQGAKESAPAPLPAQIVSAKKVFVANAGQESNPNVGGYSGGIDRTYNQFYLALKSWGRYELASTPADCDLVFEIRFTDATVGEKVFNGTAIGSKDEPEFRLAILDPKTKIVLWAFTEHVESARSQGNRDKNFDQALGRVVNDVKNLATQTADVKK